MIFWLLFLVFTTIGTLLYISSSILHALVGQSWVLRSVMAGIFFIFALVSLDALNWITVF